MIPRTTSQGRGGVEVDLRELWAALRRQWWIIVGFGMAALVAGVTLIPVPEPEYNASALVRVEQKASALAGFVGPASTQLGTEMEVLRSRSVAEAVVDSLGLQVRVARPSSLARSQVFSSIEISDSVLPGRLLFDELPNGRYSVHEESTDTPLGTIAPGEQAHLNGVTLALAYGRVRPEEFEVELLSRPQAVDRLVATVETTQPTRGADVIRVDYTAPDPALARDVVNTLLDRFLVLRNDVQKTEIRSTTELLRQQLDTLSAQLASSENELREFRERAHVIDPAVEGSTEVRRLADLQAQRSSIEAERQALQTLLTEVRAAPAPDPAAPSPYRRLAAFPTIMRSSTMVEVLRSLAEVENQRTQLLARRKLSDPDVEVLSSRIRELEGQLESFVVTYLAGLSSQVASIDASLSQFGAQLEELPANEVEFARLSRRPKVLGEMYALLQTRLKEAEIAQATDDGTVRVVDQARLPTSPVKSYWWMLMVSASTLMGLVVGVTVGFGREYLDKSVHTRGDVQAVIGVPVLGLIPKMGNKGRLQRNGYGFLAQPVSRALPAASGRSNGNGSGTVSIVHKDVDPENPLALSITTADRPTPSADAYDRLHSNILFAMGDREAKTLLTTSALPGDGKTTTAANLAVASALRGLRTLIVDADLRRGAVNAVFGVPRAPGLTEVISGTIPLSQALHTINVGRGNRLHLLTTGEFPAHPASLLGSAAMLALLEKIEQHFDRIIIDSPPVNVVADASILGRHVDGVVVVARAGVTPADALVLAAEQFSQARANVIGAVLNDIDFQREASYDPTYRAYGYGSNYYSHVAT